ncbi:MAG: FAD-binding protein [Actinomycetes bacterium]
MEAASPPTALFARWLGNRVLVLEKAPELGGTARKAAFWYWVPNNQPMRELGLEDPRDDCLRYMARLARPHRYRPDAPRFGLTEWEYAVCEAIYDGASPATELLAERGALPYRHCAPVPDYWCELPEDKVPTGGTLDTKAGPKATPDGQVLDDQDRPIPGLYGVGNCVASASAQAYWAGGATLGPILALAHRAARAAHAERVAEPQPVS